MALQFESPISLINKFQNLDVSKFEVDNKKPLQYNIRIITEDDSDVLLHHLRTFFFKDEPLNVTIKLIENESSRCYELEEYSLKCIKDGISLMATTPSGKVIGVCLNGILKIDEPEEDEKECLNPKFKKILELLNYCGQEGTNALLEKYPKVKKMLFVKILSTDKAWRGQGVARELLEKTRYIGHEQGYNLMRVDCTSYFSARAISRLGFERVYELNYEDYKENGKPVFQTEYPHTSFTVYVQKIR
ncbi:hypothetical protein FQA39_LY00598 [Lamprigera yunnana]|nr:hypothetical protein FQA39_LY00598 [Lamprigera yunnana]